ncbi:MAG: CCA tRNA nucleotidyltransferase [Candidatus Bathycorpusculaceae bacterium]
MQEEIRKVCREVLERVTPKRSDRANIESLASRLERRVASVLREHGVKAVVRTEGSIAKDTWLREEPDVDIFIRFPPAIPRKILGEVGLKIARKATEGSEQIERFAEHPYLEAIVDGVRVNVVPCYDVKRGEWLSATDRTPFHTDYVKAHLDERLKSEVRLLKRFMKGIGVYGAEIKIGGFSGYLCELLVLHHKSFINTLEAFAQYKQRITVDIENYYLGRERELQLLFREPLVIVDPVDKGRNVASAVRPQKLYTLVAAARAFMKEPDIDIFYPVKTEALPVRELRQKLEGQGSAFVFLAFGKVDAVPDVLWGQLYRSQRSLRRLVELNDFKVLRDAAWSDEEDLNVFVFELEQRVLPLVKKHLGPPLEKERECENFLAKYVANKDVVSGPYVEGGRWVVELQRKCTDVAELLREKLSDGGRSAGVAEQISQVLRKGFDIFVNVEVVEVYGKNGEFAEFLTDFLSGRPVWLEAC